eukprot:1962165-Heterocapsa_arctica.AAC.1
MYVSVAPGSSSSGGSPPTALAPLALRASDGAALSPHESEVRHGGPTEALHRSRPLGFRLGEASAHWPRAVRQRAAGPRDGHRSHLRRE